LKWWRRTAPRRWTGDSLVWKQDEGARRGRHRHDANPNGRTSSATTLRRLRAGLVFQVSQRRPPHLRGLG
jgi:hypothetical protein